MQDKLAGNLQLLEKERVANIQSRAIAGQNEHTMKENFGAESQIFEKSAANIQSSDSCMLK